MSSRMACLVVAFAAISGCTFGGFEIDEKQAYDEMVEEGLELNQDRKEPAVEFFEKGGKHYNIDLRTNAAAGVDRDLVLPLVKRLRDEFKAEVFALIPEGEEYCWEIIVKLPTKPATRSAIKRALEETDARFSGQIASEWGHKWLGFNFEDSGDE